MARGSLHELEAQLAIALDLSYVQPLLYDKLAEEIYQVLGLLNRLINSIRNKRAG